MINFEVFTKPNCIACKMTNNVMQSLHANKHVTILDPNNPQTEKLIQTLKNKYHVQQLPFVKAMKDQQMIDSWTGFQPDKIKQYA